MEKNVWKRKRILITVKAYPTYSKKYFETVCTAGITEEGQWIRLYPLPFRFLSKEQKFKKYQWIEVNVTKNEKDNREQSYRPDLSSLRIVSQPLSTKNAWEARNEIVLKTVSPSLEYLRENYPRTSLGIIRPKEILNFVAEEAPRDELYEYQQMVMDFADDGDVDIITPIKPIPFKCSYIFLCDDTNCKKPHKLSIYDWELGGLYTRLSKKSSDEEYIKQKLKEKFFDEICSPKKDTHFIVGNKYPYPDAFMILGVYYPDKVRQLTLF